jgi:tetratricopeptide (TPR) repeat protein
MHESACPGQLELSRFLTGCLSAEEIDAVDRHLAACARCLETIGSVRPADPLLDEIRVEPAASSPTMQIRLAERPEVPIVRSGGYSLTVVPRLPGYEILREVGHGGMGVIYEARHLALGRRVAVKVLRAGVAATLDELARFGREASSLARLQHPNIVQVHDVGEYEGQHFLAMEFVEGGTLAARLADGPLDAGEAATLLRALAAAVQAAHDAGVIHRDLKPANVLLCSPLPPLAGVPKITDFGLAKLVGEQGRTHSGTVLGTPAYMAPEQASGRPDAVGPAADVYSLGAVLYEVLTGQPPFRAATPVETLHQVLHQEVVPPLRMRTGVPPDLETICLKCLEKDPARRYASAGDLADDLGRYLAGEPIRARPLSQLGRAVRWARRRPLAAALLAACTVAIGVSAAWVDRNRTAHRERERAEAHQAEALRNYQRVREAVDRYLAEVIDGDDQTEGNVNRYRRFLEVAQGQYLDLLREYPDDANLRAERGRGLLRIGRIEQVLGSKEKAKDYYTRAIEALEPLTAAGSEVALDLVRARDQLGWVCRAVGQLPEAIALHEAALRDCEALLKRDPENLDARLRLARVHKNLGWALHKAKRPDWDKHFAWAVEQLGPLFEKHPDRWRDGFDLWETMRLLGRRDLLRDGPDAIEPRVRQVLAISERLLALRPKDQAARSAHATSLRDLGNLHLARGERGQAEPLFHRCREIQEQLVAEMPSAGRLKKHLAWTHHYLGRLHEPTPRAAEAVGQYRRALDLVEQGVRLNPSDVEHFSLHRTTLARLVNLLTVRGEAEAASAAIQQGRVVYPTKVPAGPVLVDLAAGFAGSAANVRKSARMSAGDRERLAEEYLGFSLELLKRAEQVGVFADAGERGRVLDGKTFAGLRGRAEYEAIVAALGKRK